MLEKFFGFESYGSTELDFMFNLNHLWLLLSVIAFVTILTLIFKNKSQKTQKIMLGTVGITMVLLESGRFVWRLLKHLSTNPTLEGFNWAWNFSFQLCAIMSWFVAINLIIYAFSKKEHTKWNVVAFNIMVGVAGLGGFLTFLYPDLIHESRALYHWENVQTILQHTLLVFAPVFLVASKKVQIKFKNLWMPLAGVASAAAIAMPMSLITDNNFMYMLRFGLLEDLGVVVPFPYHLFVLLGLFIVLDLIIYGTIIGISKLKQLFTKTDDVVIVKEK